ncbi:TPA: oxidoreductase [Burkholderia cenocepacia]|nr:oxidoreductase [Burkholderia cenocepacia]
METTHQLPAIRVRISAIATPASGVRMITLRSSSMEPLPRFTPGAHIGVAVKLANRQKDWRQYSLIELSSRNASCNAPLEYVIAVRLDEKGRGGSRFMHEALQVGDELEIQEPRNEFPLEDSDRRVALVAGGIGVTPLVTMAAACISSGRPVRMLYAGRDRSSMALIPELTEMLGDALSLHFDDANGGPFNVKALFDQFGSDTDVYTCGPAPMLDALITEAAARGWSRDRLRFELFAPPQPKSEDAAFEVILAQSCQTIHVNANKSILDALIEEGLDPLYDCKRGECGVCAVHVIEGEVDHRDYVLTEREKLQTKVMYPCVSRCKGKKLILDM